MTNDIKNNKFNLSEQEIKNITQYYQTMFLALVTINLCCGGTVGAARQKALNQMDNYIKPKINIAHPMTQYLVAANKQTRKYISKINMEKPEIANQEMKLNSTMKQRYYKSSVKEFQKYLKMLNDLYKKYMPQKEVQQQQAMVKIKVANTQQAKIFNLLQQMQR